VGGVTTGIKPAAATTTTYLGALRLLKEHVQRHDIKVARGGNDGGEQALRW